MCTWYVRAFQEVRRSWAERAYQGDDTLNLEVEAGLINHDKLYTAKQLYDNRQKVTAGCGCECCCFFRFVAGDKASKGSTERNCTSPAAESCAKV